MNTQRMSHDIHYEGNKTGLWEARVAQRKGAILNLCLTFELRLEEGKEPAMCIAFLADATVLRQE